MLGIRQWRHGAFCVSRKHRLRRILMCLFIVSLCSFPIFFWGEGRLYTGYSSSVNQSLPSVNHEQFPMQMTHKHNKWLQILAQEDFPPKLLWSENADFKFSVNNEGEKVNKKPRSRRNSRLGQRRQRRQQETEEQEIGIRGIMIVHCPKPIPADICRSKSATFQLCITARTIIIFRRTAPDQICSLFWSFSKSGRRNNATSAFQHG